MLTGYGADDTHVGAGSNSVLGLERKDAVQLSARERYSPYVVELVGTFLLTIAYICNLSNNNSAWAVSSNALMLFGLFSAFGHISGANLNPSVSISLYLSGRKSVGTMGWCFLMQSIGAALAAVVARFCMGKGVAVDIGPKPGFNAIEAALVEVLFTSMISFVFLSCAASWNNNPSRDPNQFAAIAIAFSVVAGSQACRRVSGSVMNPAIAIGLQLSNLTTEKKTGWAMLYLMCEIFGALLASCAFRVVRPMERRDSGPVAAPRNAHRSASVFAEFLGTFYTVLTKAMVHNSFASEEAWAVAAALACMVYSLRGVSGAFFNPAVTLSVYLCGGFPDLYVVGTYLGAQTLGAVSGTSVFALIGTGVDLELTPVEVTNARSSAMLVETLFMFLICYVVLTTSHTSPLASSGTRHNNVGGLAVAGAYLVSIVATNRVSGGVLNPAVALGYSGLAGIIGDASSICLPYIVYEAIGAFVASAAYSVTHKSTAKALPGSSLPRFAGLTAEEADIVRVSCHSAAHP
mmetsp:Transcript_81781/g.227695  ORF Transcript_81781/g.227695 Transcript_81781/m.227695 type:complete len:519 (+) Transcript_81781:125-1681(+)